MLNHSLELLFTLILVYIYHITYFLSLASELRSVVLRAQSIVKERRQLKEKNYLLKC